MNVIVGALLRRHFRRYLLSRGLSFTEDKGWLDSLFVIRCTNQQAWAIQTEVNRLLA